MWSFVLFENIYVQVAVLDDFQKGIIVLFRSNRL